VLKKLKKSFKVLLLLILALFTMLNGASAVKPVGGNTTSKKVTSTSSFKSITLSYEIVNTKKAADKYIIYRGTQKIYEGVNTRFTDSSLHSDNKYSYSVGASLNGRVLARSTHMAATQAILINPLEIHRLFNRMILLS
jgi:hypothetical protein